MRIIDVYRTEISCGRGFLKDFARLFLYSSKSALLQYRISNILYGRDYKIISKLIKKRLEKTYGLHISLTAQIELGLRLPHVNGIIIGDGVVIGKNATIYHQVTIGGKRLGDGKLGKYPQIGDNVVIFTGAKILGDVIIGNGAIIGANSVVTTNVEENSVYAGIPARKINKI